MKKSGKNIFTQRTISNLIVVVAGIVVFLAISNFAGIRKSFGGLLGILSPFITGAVIAYLLNMPMQFAEKKLFSKLPAKRSLAMLVVYLLAFFFFAILVGLVLPQLWASILKISQNLAHYLNNLNSLVSLIGTHFNLEEETVQNFLISYRDLLDLAARTAEQVLPQIPVITMQVGTSLVSALTALIASIYMLGSKEKLLGQTKKVLYAVLPHKNATGILRVGSLSNRIFSGFISGKLLDSAIVGCICFVFMWFMDTFITTMPFALLISVIIGITNIIPFFGPFIGAVPSIMILLLVNPWSALFFGIFIIVLQQFDGNILGPKILGDSTGLPPIWVLIAIVVGGGLFGFTGMILGVPTAAVLYTLASDGIARRLARKNLDAKGNALPPPQNDTAET